MSSISNPCRTLYDACSTSRMLSLAKCINEKGGRRDMVSKCPCMQCMYASIRCRIYCMLNIRFCTHCMREKCNVCDVWINARKSDVYMSNYFLCEKGRTEKFPEVFLHDNCEQKIIIIFCLLTKKEMRSGTHFTQQKVFLFPGWLRRVRSMKLRGKAIYKRFARCNNHNQQENGKRAYII